MVGEIEIASPWSNQGLWADRLPGTDMQKPSAVLEIFYISTDRAYTGICLCEQEDTSQIKGSEVGHTWTFVDQWRLFLCSLWEHYPVAGIFCLYNLRSCDDLLFPAFCCEKFQNYGKNFTRDTQNPITWVLSIKLLLICFINYLPTLSMCVFCFLICCPQSNLLSRLLGRDVGRLSYETGLQWSKQSRWSSPPPTLTLCDGVSGSCETDQRTVALFYIVPAIVASKASQCLSFPCNFYVMNFLFFFFSF